ncbi:hypothetical protein PIB30_093715, partial [Stylosanthes scabra]|nr:hypothetical protein [Stylosanthes scabra]
GEKNKKFKKKQKAYMSWENEDDSSIDSDDDEVANICLMENEEKSNTRSPARFPYLTFKELVLDNLDQRDETERTNTKSYLRLDPSIS